MTFSPQFSIDLDAELHKITQRQHLNDVHYLVALVRHALAHNPQAINIHSQKQRLVFSQDGLSLETKEWDAFRALLKRGSDAEESQQYALNLLETVYGIALLSLFLRFDAVTLTSGHMRMRTRGGELVAIEPTDEVVGYRIEIERARNHREKEETELKFYCAGAKVPITYNQRTINRPLRLENHLLALDFHNKKGHGSICIPRQGELSRFYFFKAGIRVGVKTFSPEQGRIVEGYWNEANPKFESLYRQTIQTGQPLLASHTQMIYQAIPKHFQGLAGNFKGRLKKILLGIDPLGWACDFGSIQLFDNSDEKYILCLKDLLNLRQNFEVIPFLSKAKSRAPKFVPVLQGEDQYFLSHHLRLKLKPLVGQLQTQTADVVKPTTNPPRTISSKDLSPDWRGFLFALNQHRLPMKFRLTHDATRTRVRKNGYRDVWLCLEDTHVKNAFEAFCKNPQSAHQWRYRFLANLA